MEGGAFFPASPDMTLIEAVGVDLLGYIPQSLTDERAKISRDLQDFMFLNAFDIHDPAIGGSAFSLYQTLPWRQGRAKLVSS